MGGTKSGGKLAAASNKANYGPDFYAVIGARGGAASGTGGFGQGEAGKARARVYGKLGGLVSRRGATPLNQREKAKLKARFKKQYANNLAHLHAIHDQARAEKLANNV